MATVTVRRKPTYVELEAKVKELQDALAIAERNKYLRDMGWDMLHSQIAELQRENRGLRADLTRSQKLTEELNDQITADAAEITELKADRQIALDEVDRLRTRLTERDKTNESATKAAMEMAEMLTKANTERDEARSEAEDLKLEVQERDFRIDELEKQAEWLRDKNEEWAGVAAGLQKDVKFWKKAAEENAEGWRHAEIDLKTAQDKCETLKKAVDEISEQSASFCATAQYWEDKTHKLEEEIGLHVAEKDYLERQLKANEEEYDNLRKMYVELRDASSVIANHFRANTFAN